MEELSKLLKVSFLAWLIVFLSLVGSSANLAYANGVNDPTLVGTVPISGWPAWSPKDPLSIIFNEPVKASSEEGLIKIHVYETNEVFWSAKSSDDLVSYVNNQVIIDAPDLEIDTRYYVTVESSAFIDLDDNAFAGFLDKDTWFFITDDDLPPYVISFMPEHNTVYSANCSCINMRFNEIVKEFPGSISLYKMDDTLVETVPTGQGDSRIDVFFDLVEIDFSTQFQEDQQYYITVSEGAMVSFFTDDPMDEIVRLKWRFRYKSAPTITQLSPESGATNVDGQNLSIEFDADIDWESGGYLYVHDYETDALLEALPTLRMDYSGNVVSLRLKERYPSYAHLYILADPDASFRNRETTTQFQGLDSKENWSFTLAESNQKPFISTWQIATDGESITIPTEGDGYYYAVDWGDDSVETGFTAKATHTYAQAGDYTVKITGRFPRVYFNNEGSKDLITDVEQWGDIKWRSMSDSFYGCSNLRLNATDAPDLSNVVSLNSMFRGAAEVNGKMDHWDVSNIKDMSYLFAGAISFNQNISDWNISSLESVIGLFQNATSYNQPIDSWDLSVFNELTSLFEGATSFNQPMPNWDLWRVRGLKAMFKNATSFNQDIGGWNVLNLIDMTDFLSGAAAFDQNMAKWDIRGVKNLEGVFDNSGMSARNYDKTLNGWINQSGLVSEINLGVVGLTFCNSQYSRQSFIDDYGWVFTGDQQNCESLEFITTWQTDEDDQTITIPTLGGGYRYSVDWGDGTVVEEQTGNAVHTYALAGDYSISISGNFPRIHLNFEGMSLKIQSIDQWGGIEWQTMERAFDHCRSLTYKATDQPDLEKVTDMAYMFAHATTFNGAIGNWDVSSATSMEGTFNGTFFFNQPLNNWDVSNVKNMKGMFSSARVFNQDLSDWDVSKVESMEAMFVAAWVFNGKIGSWDISNVQDLRRMFKFAYAFNQDIGSWNTSNLTRLDGLFSDAQAFNQDIGSWDVSNVISLVETFLRASSFNQNLNNWDVSSVRSTYETFYGASAFNQPLDRWDMSSVVVTRAMFQRARSFNQPIGDWNLSNVKNTVNMLDGAYAFNQPIGDWDMSSVIDMGRMFNGARVFNQDISTWEVGKVDNMEYMFANTSRFNQDITDWDVSKVKSTEGMFSGASTFNQDISGWNLSKVTIMRSMFSSAEAFNQDISSWDVSHIESMRSMFLSAKSFDQDLSQWDVSNVFSFFYAFNNSGLSIRNYDRMLTAWAELPLKYEGVKMGVAGLSYCEGETARNKLVNDYGWLIEGDSKDCLELVSFVTKWVTTEENETISIPTKGTGYDYRVNWGDGTIDAVLTADATHTFETPGIYQIEINGDFPRIYINDSGDKEKLLSIEQWGNIQWRSMANAFQGSVNLKYNANDKPDLSAVTDLSYMFADCSSLDMQMGEWDVSQVTNMEGMLSYSGLFYRNYDQTLIDWAATESLQSGVKLGAHGLLYCNSEEVRSMLISDKGWTFEGDINECPNLEAPVFTSPPMVDFRENSSELVYNITTTDIDSPPEQIVYSLGIAGDEGLFTLTDSEIRFKGVPDYESPTDSDENNIYVIEIIATDGTHTNRQELFVNVIDVDEIPPEIISALYPRWLENIPHTYVISARDETVSFGLLSYWIGSDNDEALFRKTGGNAFEIIEYPDYENPIDGDQNNQYIIEVFVSDGENTVSEIVTISIVNDNDEKPEFTSPAAVSVEENISEVAYTVSATDIDSEGLEYGLLSVKDHELFNIENGMITFISPPDFENPSDTNGDNHYELTVTASDEDFSVEMEVTITVVDSDDISPTLTSENTVDFAENGTEIVYIATATDPDSDEITFSLGSSKDERHFTIEENSLRFNIVPDFENPVDENRDNVYLVDLIASDGSNESLTTLSIRVTDLDDIVTSIEDDFFKLGRATVYPIPAIDNLYVEILQPSTGLFEILLVSSDGTTAFRYKTKDRLTAIELSGLSSGVYFVTVTNGKFIGRKKIMIRK